MVGGTQPREGAGEGEGPEGAGGQPAAVHRPAWHRFGMGFDGLEGTALQAQDPMGRREEGELPCLARNPVGRQRPGPPPGMLSSKTLRPRYPPELGTVVMRPAGSVFGPPGEVRAPS